MVKKLLVLSILILFIGMSVCSSTENNVKNDTINIELLDVVDNTKVISVQGHIAFAYCQSLCPHGEGSCYFDLENPKDITQLSNECLPNFASGGTWINDGRWLICDYSNGALYDIDPETGEISIIGGGGTGLNGLEYNPLTEKLYGASCSDLYEIEITTGNQTYIGAFDTSTCMVAIAFDINGICYGLDVKFSGDPYLYKINTSTGGTTFVTPLINCSTSWILNAAFDRDNEIFYLLGIGLYICNTETGECTRVGTENLPELTGFTIPYGKPEPPIITGPKQGSVGVEYEYSFKLSDPNDNEIYLRVDWGNGTSGSWIGSYDSGTTVELNHTWDEQGNFTIRAQAKDIYNAESEWGTLEVTIPRYKTLNNSLFLKYLDRFPLLQRLLNIFWGAIID